MAKDSEDKDHNFTKRSELLDDIKRYFGIESQEDVIKFQNYIRRHTNSQQENKSNKD